MAVLRRQDKGALLRSAPFALWTCLFFLPFISPVEASPACALEHADAAAKVSHVYDGDTVKLEDGRKLRFIGINTPEIDHDGGASEPYSHAARKRLEQLIGNKPIRLRYGKERSDRYGRLLAHAYLDDGRSINTLLLQDGLATTLVVPPNTWNYDCYLAVERRAREKGLGIWSLPRYRPHRVEELPPIKAGFRLVEGVVEQVVEGRNSVWLELVGPVALRISHQDRENFPDWNMGALVGRRVVARGWPVRREGKWRMRVRHPAALEIGSAR